ncbi:MAG: DUF262 domain-containing protein [Pontiellaceae bacterium]|nr:DUF262 domain-containing protein [Pontiellaceae bacterium]MBN2783642.1 DUF262 domain-containing protein [Pontiellaceae bacterium]
MKAQDLPLTQLLQGSKQFIIPIFQRTYSWDRGNCEQLWKDILRVGSTDKLDSHFIGSAVYIPEQDTSAAISRWLVIDGQQRITTVTLLLLALMNRLAAEGAADPISPEEIEDYYLKNRYGKEDLKYKMLLTKTDKDTLIALLDNKEPGEKASKRILDNYAFFVEQLANADLKAVYTGIQKLMIVDVRLQHGIDNPQMIFESMNSTGKALTQADLIRNFVLMGLEHDLQTRLYNDYWRPMEVAFGADNYINQFDEFMRYFLVIHTGNHRIRRDEVYDEFKAYSRDQEVEQLLMRLKEFTHYYCDIALGRGQDKELGAALHDIRELRADVCYPLLMEVYQDYRNNHVTKEEFLEVIRMVESYVFRRAVCDIPTNSLRQTFAMFCRRLKKDRYLESVKATFLLLQSYRRFPSESEFIQKIQERNLYNFNRRSYWLRRIENHGRKERVLVQEYTIEHILPQNDNLSDEWQDMLGSDWKQVQETYLHTLGNLTLTGYNSELSDRPFHEKRDMEGGFADSPIRLNAGLGSLHKWDADEIKKRATTLAGKAASVWGEPSLEETILDAYRQKTQETGYTIDDHRHLLEGKNRELFDAFRREVLALDPCITEEFLKLYVAYKAETNFVDIVPQARKLRLTLNMRFHEIDDPHGLCEDVTNLGRWGNGDIQISFSELDQLPAVMGLVRQSLELQMGDGDVD